MVFPIGMTVIPPTLAIFKMFLQFVAIPSAFGIQLSLFGVFRKLVFNFELIIFAIEEKVVMSGRKSFFVSVCSNLKCLKTVPQERERF